MDTGRRFAVAYESHCNEVNLRSSGNCQQNGQLSPPGIAVLMPSDAASPVGTEGGIQQARR